MIHGTHNLSLVVVSVVIAIFASYTSLDLAHRITVARGGARLIWLAGGSSVMGLGIWSMHFVAMLSFSIPGTPIAYDVPLVILSLCVAVLASALALFVVSRRVLPAARLLTAGLAMGLAISGMHYIGIWGMRLSARVHWDRTLVIASVLIAIGASLAALWLAFRWREQSGARTVVIRLMAGTVMGVAISGMHYTAMAAMRFTPGRAGVRIGEGNVLATEGLAVVVALATVIILIIAMLGSIMQRELDRRRLMLDEMQRLFRESEKRASEEEALRRATESVAAAISYEQVLEQIAHQAVGAMGADSALVERVAEERTDVVIAAAWGTPEARIGTRLEYSESFSSRVAGQNRPQVMKDLKRVPGIEETTRAGPFSVLCVPLELDGSEVGALVLLRGAERPPFQPGESARASIFSHLSAMAFRRVQLLAEAERRREQVERAERLSALARLASTVAHEFNNVLMAVQAFHEVARRAGSYEQYLKTAPQVDRAIARGKSITDGVLRLTRAAQPEPAAIHVCQWLETIQPDLRMLLSDAIDFRIECEDRSLFVWADASHIEQVFVNLTVNARGAMPNGGTFHITVAPLGDERIEFTLSDDGCGMSPEVQQRIFEPLYTTRKEGTGLGLSITYEIIQAHGGSIAVDSARGKGTTFRITLPRAAESRATSALSGPERVKTRRRVLLVEDDDAVAEGLRLMMELEGLEVNRVALGGDALSAIMEFHPEVLVLDVGLPDVDGYTVYRQVEKQFPALPVVFATGHAERSALEQIDGRARIMFLRKPFDGESLLSAIDAVAKAADV